MAASKSQECFEYKTELLTDGMLETYSGDLSYNETCNSKLSDVIFAVWKKISTKL